MKKDKKSFNNKKKEDHKDFYKLIKKYGFIGHKAHNEMNEEKEEIVKTL